MGKFIRFDKTTGKVTGVIQCPDKLAPFQEDAEQGVLALDEDIQNPESMMVNLDDGSLYEKPKHIKDAEILEIRMLRKPELDLTLDDTALNQQISDYYLGTVDPVQWRLDNYEWLRQLAYPPVQEFIDAQVKLKSKDVSEISFDESKEGDDQLKVYVKACYDVKVRFPKP